MIVEINGNNQKSSENEEFRTFSQYLVIKGMDKV